MSRILGTVRRGRVKIRSQRQMRFLEAHHIDHTHITKSGKKVRHTWR